MGKEEMGTGWTASEPVNRQTAGSMPHSYSQTFVNKGK